MSILRILSAKTSAAAVAAGSLVLGSLASSQTVLIDYDDGVPGGRLHAAPSASPAPGLAAKPNIVLVYSDDVGYGDVNGYGSGIVPTPRIDSLASTGMRFTDAHSPASTCTPSRYSMLTGEYAWRTAGTGIASGVSPLLIRPGSVTLPSMLRQAGYATAVIGKWHLGLGSGTTDYNAASIAPGPLEIGFDYYFGMPATADRVPCVYLENHHIVNYHPADPLQVSYTSMVGDEPTGTSHPELLKYYTANASHSKTIIDGISRIGWMDGGVAARWRDEDHADIFVAKAGAFIAQHAAASKPFFIYLASSDIHVPRAPHERFQGVSPHGWRGDAILQLDWTVGALLDRLADPDNDGNQSDSVVANTLFIFTSDNGPVGNDGYNDGSGASTSVTEFADGHDSNGVFSGGKYSIREGGTRVPFLAQWPGKIPAGLTSAALISATDFMATFAALTGQALPTDAGPDSENILPALLGQSPAGRAVLVTQNNNQNPKGVRSGNWKYLSDTGALYNLSTDPAETANLAASNPAVRDQLLGILTDSTATPMLSPLLGWWPFDDATGSSARDLSGASRPAGLTGSPAWSVDGGLAHLHFDGNDDSAQVAGMPAVTGDFTVAGWARSASASFATAGALVARRPAFALVPVAGTRQLRFIVYSTPGTPQTVICDLGAIPGLDLTHWHHYAASYDASSGAAVLYVDGVARASATFAAGPPNADNGPLFLGSDEGAASFAGDLSDVRLYSGLLPAQRIANAASSRLADSDGDGMPGDWEHRYMLDPYDPSDAAGDPDGDGIPNLDEFKANTSPLVSNVAGSGLVARWKLDETSGTNASDASGNQHAGTLVNAPGWTAGPGRRFLTFNGTSQYVSVASIPDLRSQVTAACWARSDTPAWNFAGTLVSRRPQFILHPWLNSTRLSFLVFHGGAQSGAEIYLNTIPGFSLTDWHHYAGTYDSASGTIRLYVDGILRATTPITPTLLDSTTGPLHLGKDVNFARYLDGAIDDARIHDRALTAAEIMAMTAGFDDDQDGLHDEFERRLIEAGAAYTTLADVDPTDDPDNRGDFLRITGHQLFENEGSRAFSVTLAGSAGRSYTLLESPDLAGSWKPVATTAPLAADQAVILTDFDPPSERAFYRIEVGYTP
jgi:arylsulfatase A-like enzyme